MTFTLRWNKPVRKIVNKRILKDGQAAKFMAVTWWRLFHQFVPMDTGYLASDSVDITAEGSRGRIHHKATYARPVYFGVGRNFSKAKHIHASALWDEAAKRAGRHKVLEREVYAFIRGQRNRRH